MSDTIVSAEAVEEVQPTEPRLDMLDEQLTGQLVDRARAEGITLTGAGGLLQQLTKKVLESPLRASSPATSATTSTTRPVPAAATLATGRGR